MFIVSNYYVYLLGKGGYVFSCVCLSFFPSVLCVSNISQQGFQQIAMKFYGGVRGGKRSKCLYFGTDLDHHADCSVGYRVLLNKL